MATREVDLALLPDPSPGAVSRWLPLAIGLVAAGALAFLATVNPLLAVAVGGAALLSIAIIVRPDTATLVVVALLYSNGAAIAVHDHNLPYSVGTAFPILLLAPLAYLVVVRRQPLVITPALPWVLAFCVAMILATMFSGDFEVSWKELRQFLIEGLLLYVLVTNAIRTPDLLRKVIWVVVIVAAALSLLSVYQQFTGTYDNDYLGFAQVTKNNEGFVVSESGINETTQRRLGGPIGEENRYGQILLAILPLAIFCGLTERRAWLRLAGGACSLLIAFGVALTFSRGAAIGFVGVMIAMLLLRLIKLRHLALVVLGVVIVLAAVPSYLVRLSTLTTIPAITSSGSTTVPDSAATSRSTENLAAFLIASDHPLVGVGPGEFPTYYRRYAERVRDYSNSIDVKVKYANRQAHNLYLGMLAETGVIGLVAFLGVLGATLLQLFRVRRRTRRSRPDLANLCSAFIASVLAYMLTGVFLHLSYQRYFWLFVALAGCAGVIAARAAREPAGDGDPDGEPYWRRETAQPLLRRRPRRPAPRPYGAPQAPRGLA